MILTKKINTYSAEEVKKEALDYFGQDELAASTWMAKYAMKDFVGNFLEKNPADMHRRMAKEFARIEAKFTLKSHPEMSALYSKIPVLDEEKLFNYFDHFRYIIPQGSVMSVLGNPHVIGSLSNCVVLPEIFDSYGGICHTDQQLAQLFKRRCGVGIDLSSLRPNLAPVANTASSSTGAVSFMERFSNTTKEVSQNGRRGALMMTMDIRHPDILDFITIKQDLTKVTGANLSIKITDEFMHAVENDTLFTLRWPIESHKPLISKEIKAKEIWDTIIRCAHQSAEPGVIFWDQQHLNSPSSIYPQYKNISTNPCSEIAMQGGDSCRLIALNLFSFIKNPFTKEAEFDAAKFEEVVYVSQRLMDDLVELELESIEKILAKIKQDPEPDYIKKTEIETWELLYKNGKEGRRTGLGFTALADFLAALGIKYDSNTAIEMVEKIMRLKCKTEFDASVDLAIERGAFSGYSSEIEKASHFTNMLKAEFPDLHTRMLKFGRRNVSLSTVAPTGTVSLLAQTSSGLEPVFMTSYKRRKKITEQDRIAEKDIFRTETGDKYQEFEVFHPKLTLWKTLNPTLSLDQNPYKGATAQEIDWEKRIEIQAIIQKFVTHSISSTLNLAENVSEETVSNVYLRAWQKKLKGVTVYREGSRSGILVRSDETQKNHNEDYKAPDRPMMLETDLLRFRNNNETWLAFVGLLGKRPYEIFTGRELDSFMLPAYVEKGWIIKTKIGDHSRYDFQYVDKDGYKVTIEGLSRSFNKEYWNYAKLLSGVMRQGMPMTQIVSLVSNLYLYDENINTWKNGVMRSLKKYIASGEVAHEKSCPNCQAKKTLIYEEGCVKCKECGFSKCD